MTDAPDLAPRPRPGWRTPPEAGPKKAELVAGVVRAGAGCAGFFAALLWLPIHVATPVLAGVSLLMVATGTASTWRSVSEAPRFRRVPLVVGGVCGLLVAATVILTVVLGAGAFGPSRPPVRDDGPPTIHFEAP